MVEKIIFTKTMGIYFPVYVESDRNFLLARFLDDDIGQDRDNSWLQFFENDK